MTTQQPESLRVSGLLRVTGHKAVSANMISDAILVIESQHARITELEAARFAYASEFAPTSDGDPDVSSIHANIRALKAQLAQRFDAADMATAAAQGFRDGATATAQPVAEPADTVVLNAAMRAIQQAIELIGAPTDERIRAVRRVLRGAVIVAEDAGKVAPQPSYTAQAADSVQEDAARWREHVGKLDALVAYCPTCCQGFIAKQDMTRDEVLFACGKAVGQSGAKRLREALDLAVDHIDMDALRISHCKDAAVIDAARKQGASQ